LLLLLLLSLSKHFTFPGRFGVIGWMILTL
jgi:hypothetical protein